MRAGVFRGARRMSVEEVPDPVAGARDVVLDVRACGVCGSDLHAYTTGLFAQTGQIMGHEFAGEVVQVGPAVDGIAVGDRVTGVPIQPCGTCRRCRTGAGHLCGHRASWLIKADGAASSSSTARLSFPLSWPRSARAIQSSSWPWSR